MGLRVEDLHRTHEIALAQQALGRGSTVGCGIPCDESLVEFKEDFSGKGLLTYGVSLALGTGGLHHPGLGQELGFQGRRRPGTIHDGPGRATA